MSCGNNKGNLGSFKGIYDFDVKYTGCSSDCGGIEIKSGDTLRNVLDALVSNCDGGGPGPGETSTNFWFSVEVPTFTEDVKNGDFALTGEGEIYQFTAGAWVNTGIQIGGGTGGGGSWGEITGDITDQTDLTDYINLLISEGTEVGFGLTKTEDGAIRLGKELIPDSNLQVVLAPEETQAFYLAYADSDGNLDFTKSGVHLGAEQVDVTFNGVGFTVTDDEMTIGSPDLGNQKPLSLQASVSTFSGGPVQVPTIEVSEALRIDGSTLPSQINNGVILSDGEGGFHKLLVDSDGNLSTQPFTP